MRSTVSKMSLADLAFKSPAWWKPEDLHVFTRGQPDPKKIA